jgi:hypothetical protein
VAIVVAVGIPTGGASSLSRGPEGWLLARSYLEETLEETVEETAGTAAEEDTGPVVWDRPLADLPEEARTVVLTLPGSGILGVEAQEALRDFLHRGGTVVVAYGGGAVQRGEEVALEALDLRRETARPAPPLTFTAWKAHRKAVWELEPGDGWGGTFSGTSPTLTAVDWAPAPPRGSTIWFTGGEEDTPLVFSIPRQEGTVWVLPARLFANGHLLREGNADFLETLVSTLGGDWYFDEYHHGFLAADAAATGTSRRLFDLLLLHLALLYALVVWRLLRRFGPAWAPQPRLVSSNASFLKGLGALHHRFGHHHRAATLLLERARRLDPRMRIPERLQAAAAHPASLRELAVAVAELQGDPLRTATPSDSESADDERSR